MNKKLSVVLAALVMLSVIGVGVVSADVSVPTSVNVQAQIVSITTESCDLNFGSLLAGSTRDATCTIKGGNVNQKITATATNMIGATNNANNIPGPNVIGTQPYLLAPNPATLDIQLQLDVPVDAKTDDYNGTLDIVATVASEAGAS